MPFNNLVVYRISKHNPGVGKRLAKALKCDIVTSKKNILPNGTLVFNYGRSDIPKFHFDNITYLNHPDSVNRAVNKLDTLVILDKKHIPCLTFTTDKNIANTWRKKGTSVICRTTLVGKKGNGIIFHKYNDPTSLPNCPLYTRYFPKTHEFRVHVFRGKVIDFVQKKKMGKNKLFKLGLEKSDVIKRNNKRGWVFAHNDLICNEEEKNSICNLAISAVDALGLDFGGVDILARFLKREEFNYYLSEAVVCEINSAPGMKCTQTFNAYVDNIKEALEI